MSRNIGAPEVAARLGVSIRTVDRMAEDGRLTPVRRAPGVRGRRYYDDDEVERVRLGLTDEDMAQQ